jgi:hypothetical protein
LIGAFAPRLKHIADARGLGGTLAHILECAAIEAKWHADQERASARSAETMKRSSIALLST